MTTESPTERTGEPERTKLGLPPNVLAVLGYVFSVVGAVVLLVVEDDRFVRHHAAQSLLFTGAVVVARVLADLVGGVLSLVPVVGAPLAILLGQLVWVGAGVGFLVLAYKAYAGERYALPVLGQYIEDVAGVF